MLVGVLAVLGVVFAAGALTGRFSLRAPTSVASARTAERTAKPAPQPELTFYRELTAPLTPPPLPPKPAAKPAPKREAPPPAEPAKRAEPGDAPARPAADPTAVPATPPRADAGRYTVQVGSYNVRAQAEAMRARLATAGLDAYIAEGEAAGVVRYRVRIGAFPTAEDARQAAVRLASQAQVATYVTTR
jgi:cell division protein FtsN